MKFERRDFGKLKHGALRAAVLLAVAIAALAWTTIDERKARTEHNAALAAKNSIEQKLGQIRADEPDIRRRIEQFRAMDEAGIVGPERRLDWTEQLRDLQRELRLPGMSYEFGPQTALDGAPASGYAYHASNLKVRLRLLHEGDLLNFLDRLQREAKAMVLVRNCRMARLPSGDAGADGARLSAECSMEWVTLSQPSARKKP
jgi:hypothetical protein